MKFKNYYPTFRNVLLLELKKDKTESGIYIPQASTTQRDRTYIVVKTGRDCSEVKEDDVVRISNGIFTETIVLGGVEYSQVMEQQVIGYVRETDDSNREPPSSKPKVTRSSKL